MHTLPQVTEKLSHGDPAFFVGKRCFVMFKHNHHGVGWLGMWCASTAEFRSALLEEDERAYFVPPYVGHRGWLGVRLDAGLETGRVLDHLLEAYCCVAPARLQAQVTG
jgi:hypothetical protein